MQTIPIQSVPNQTFTATLNEIRYSITIKEANGTMAVDVSVNDIVVITGLEAVAGSLLIPYSHLENGNFVFVTQNDELPDYREFGSSQFLVYIPQSELDAGR